MFTGLYIGLWKYWNLQSEAKVELIIANVTTCSVFCFSFLPLFTFWTLDFNMGLDNHELDKHILWIIYFSLTFQQTVYLINSFHTFFTQNLAWKLTPVSTPCNLGQKVGDKLTKLSKIGFSMEWFKADFLQFFTKNVKIWLFVGRLGTRHQIQAFQGFSGNALKPQKWSVFFQQK